MGRSSSAAPWLPLLLVGLLAASLVPSCEAARPIKTTNTRWSLHLGLPADPDNGAVVTGAESIAFDGDGRGPYTGVSDGRVLRWDGTAVGWTDFAHHPNYRRLPMCSTTRVAPARETEDLCGRPLGLAFHAKSRYLYVADAYLGLLRVAPGGGDAEVLATKADGVRFQFLNGIDVDEATGDVYMTDSSLTYPRRFNNEIIFNADATGRLLKYEARTGHVSVLKSGLPYPNGVAVSQDGTHLVVSHTVPCQAVRYWIKGARAGESELFADLPGYPDNVRRDGKGGYWVALNQEKARPNVNPTTAPVKHLVGVRLDGNGLQVEELTAAKGVTLSEVTERDGKLWLGSVELDYIGIVTSSV